MPDSSPAVPTSVFPPAGRAEWDALVSAEPSGRIARGLPTRAGIPREVVYDGSMTPALDPSRRGSGAPGRPWIAIQRHTDPDLRSLNAALREDVAGGVDGLWVDLRASRLNSSAALRVAFDGVDLAALSYLGMDGCSDAQGRLATVQRWLAARGDDLSGLTVSLRADPLRTLALDGVVPGDLQLALDRLQRAVDHAADLPRARVVSLSAAPILGAGGHMVHALGWLLANGAWVLRGLDLRLRPVADMAAQIELHLPLGSDLFEGIAAVRALRIVWRRLLLACGHPAPSAAFVHADASSGTATRNGPWINMLRGTGQVFAGALGGADAVTAAPFDGALGRSDRLARRVARNTHHVLDAEAHLGDVADPGGGSWYIESLTDALARGAWAELHAIEAAGGAAEALTSGWLRGRLDAAWAARAARIATRAAPITGVSEFAHIAEELPAREPAPVVDTSTTAGVRIAPLPRRRDAEPFEALRARTAGAPPRVFLATVGPRSEWNARAVWIANVLAAAGIDVVEPEPADRLDVDAVLARYTASGAGAACIVAADHRYGEAVPLLAPRLHGPVLLAGKPPDGGWPGVDACVFVGADLVELLAELLTGMGVR